MRLGSLSLVPLLVLGSSSTASAVAAQSRSAPTAQIEDVVDWLVVERIHLDSPTLAANEPPVDRKADPEGWREWVRSSTLVEEAHPAPGGGWLVRLVRLAGEEPERRLLHVDRTGTRIWEVADAPLLLAVDVAEEVLYFAEPTGLQPHMVWRARLR